MSLFFPPELMAGAISTNAFIVASTISSVVTFNTSTLVTLSAQELQWVHLSTTMGICIIENPNRKPIPAGDLEKIKSTTLSLANPVSSSILLASPLFNS
jgi:hypothetical protein